MTWYTPGWRAPHARSRCVLGFLLGVIAGTGALAAQTGARTFNVPAGAAGRTLKLFSAQSGVQLAYSTDMVQGVQTNAISGDYQPVDALERMVAGTPLTVIRDEKPGAFAIKRDKRPNVRRAAESTPSNRPRIQGNPTLSIAHPKP